MTGFFYKYFNLKNNQSLICSINHLQAKKYLNKIKKTKVGMSFFIFLADSP
jgi:hypothetical protein